MKVTPFGKGSPKQAGSYFSVPDSSSISISSTIGGGSACDGARQDACCAFGCLGLGLLSHANPSTIKPVPEYFFLSAAVYFGYKSVSRFVTKSKQL